MIASGNRSAPPVSQGGAPKAAGGPQWEGCAAWGGVDAVQDSRLAPSAGQCIVLGEVKGRTPLWSMAEPQWAFM